jgi:hypothetical protein
MAGSLIFAALWPSTKCQALKRAVIGWKRPRH